MEAPKEYRTALYLDNHFRLLREEIIAELREDIQSLRKKNKRRRPVFVLRDLLIIGLFGGEERKWRS